ncbi:expressed unknown protein [Seminavis robusta]|uniref:Uncharacterized protein n=1 Tax=Seminavis robusta TaxID=568900 RepID=A0A9N8F3V5_9STRA|nr:expressed unknown protein [Seminavis robusta]|eukprot:Sro3673_g350160.1 n/a (285) ;mRNA; r:865-1719
MRIQSFLVQGAGSALAGRLGLLTAPQPPDALVLMSLGVDQATLLDSLKQHKEKIQDRKVYVTETYGILGFDQDLKQNVELMEKGRGSEYGCCGGSGGQGCVAIGYYDGAIAGHTDDFPKDVASLMVVADQSKSWAAVQAKAPLHYGGITKQCWKVNTEGNEISLVEVPYFWVADNQGAMTGVATFKGDAAEATKSLLQELPKGYKTTGDVGLFPCFTRGVNEYGEENVESTVIGSVMPSPRIYGMFAHGELGPTSFASFTDKPNNLPCTQHGSTSILSIHRDKN